MIPIVVRFKNLKETESYLKRLTPRMNREIAHSVKEAGEQTVEMAKLYAPKKTGALVRAIHFVPSKVKGGWHSMVVADVPKHKSGRGIPYQAYIETGNVKPNWGVRKGTRWRLHFMTRAFEFTRKNFPKSLTRRIELALARP